MLRRVERYMRDNAMTEIGDTVIVGVSGGADSVCLLHLLARLSGELGIHLSVCHLNHGIRGAEAERDAAYVKDLCAKLQVPCEVYRRDVPAFAAEMNMTVEEAGRYMRRRVYAEMMERIHARKIALAHHEDDLAETVLMNCARGTGISGLAALRPVRGAYIRPLLCVSRAEIEAWLSAEGIGYCTDSTNADTEITRNAVRNIILPQMEKRVNHRTKRHLADLSKDARELTEFLEKECEDRKTRYVTKSGGGLLVSVSCAQCETGYMQSMVIRSVLTELAGSAKDITRHHVDDILGLFGKICGSQIDLPYGLVAERLRGGVRICTKREPQSVTLREQILTVPGDFEVGTGILSTKICAYDGRPIPRKLYTKTFDYDKIKGILELRTRLPGDFIVIHPDGRRKSFSDYLTDIKAERAIRDRIPVIACGREILWAIGFRSGESMRVDGHTKQILTMTFTAGNAEE